MEILTFERVLWTCILHTIHDKMSYDRYTAMYKIQHITLAYYITAEGSGNRSKRDLLPQILVCKRQLYFPSQANLQEKENIELYDIIILWSNSLLQGY